MNPRITIESFAQSGKRVVNYRIAGLIAVQVTQTPTTFSGNQYPNPRYTWIAQTLAGDTDRLAAFIDCLQMAHATMEVWSEDVPVPTVPSTPIASVGHQLTVADFVAEQDKLVLGRLAG